MTIQNNENTKQQYQHISDPNVPIYTKPLNSYERMLEDSKYWFLLYIVIFLCAIIGIVFTCVEIISKIFNTNNKL